MALEKLATVVEVDSACSDGFGSWICGYSDMVRVVHS